MPPGRASARRAAMKTAIASASGLVAWCSQGRPSAALAVASAAASTSSASAIESRPCSTPPMAHSAAVSAASHTLERESGMPSENHRNTATAASSSRNCTPANHCAPRPTSGS